MNGRDQTFMKVQLATIGIVLDQPTEPRRTAAATPAVVDRQQIRQILVAAGAPDRDLDWLTASCPSIEAACGYRPTSE